MTLLGDYEPLTLEDAVKRSARVLEVFIKNGIKILRIGLCESEGLSRSDSLIAGPYHPAIGELVIGEVYYNIILSSIELSSIKRGTDIEITAPINEASKVIGHKKQNKLRLLEQLDIRIKKVKERVLPPYSVVVEECESK